MKKIILVSVAFFAFAFCSNAQIVKGLLKSAANQAAQSTQNRANKEVEKKVDKGMNKLFDSILKEDTTKTKEAENTGGTSGSEEAASKSLSRIMGAIGANTNVKKKDQYNFSSQVVMEVELTDAEGQKMPTMTNEIYFDEKGSDFGMKSDGYQNGKTYFVFDFENKCTLILTDDNGKKTGIATNIGAEDLKKYAPDETATTEDKKEEACFKKTGNSKKINGYSCTEYVCDDSEGTTTVWASNELNKKINGFYNSNMSGNSKSTVKTTGFDGVAIVYQFKSKKDKTESKTTMKSFDANKSNSISTVGYEIMGFSIGSK